MMLQSSKFCAAVCALLLQAAVVGDAAAADAAAADAAAAGAAAAGGCDTGLVELVARTVAIDKEGGKAEGLVAGACKQWPHDRKLTLAALAFRGDNDGNKIFVVATVDMAAQRVASSYKTVVGEDAATEFGPNSLVIDSAPYQLSPTLRAFGVRFHSSARGASCPDGIWGDELTLFVSRGNVAWPVLQGMPMSRSEARKGCFGNASPELVYDEAKLSVAVSGSATQGFADLQVTARISRNAPGLAQGGKPAIERHALRFDGEQYRPAAKKPWWLLFFPLGM